MSGSGAAKNLLGLARATLLTIFPARSDLRRPRLVFDLRVVAAKVIGRLADGVVSEKSNPFVQTKARWNHELRG